MSACEPYLVRHRLAEIVEQRGSLRRLHARAELGGHDPGEVGALERMLENVLPVTRPVPEPAEDLHERFVHLPAVGLEDRLLARLLDVLFDLRLRAVVHLLDSGRMDAPVLDELRERELRHLPANPVER